jgi:serine phosphatase RsbU (regulator of sigma subunit)
MKSEVPRILIENGIDPLDYDLQELYEMGRKNILNNIEFYYDKEYSCKSVLKTLFTDGILSFIQSKGRSKLEILVEEKTKKITEENKKMTEKNREITQSIEYARSLQRSTLPSMSKINRYLKNHFLYYNPKDIIGGDFFWFENCGDYLFFAVADCTGHGVPGGMVSLVCSNALNKCVNELKILNTSDILNKSRELVIESFNKNEESLNDGMDIILCRYDIKSRRLEFSGANRPLWVMRNENKILEEFKTDRQPVGKFITSNSFSSFEIDIDSNDMIYMFSDGYIDQFGGDDESKFKTSRFRDLINKIKYIQIKEQESTIKTNFEEWKGSFEQTDDICVWGIML